MIEVLTLFSLCFNLVLSTLFFQQFNDFKKESQKLKKSYEKEIESLQSLNNNNADSMRVLKNQIDEMEIRVAQLRMGR